MAVRRVIANNTLLDEASALVASGERVEIPTKGNSMLPFIIGGKDTVVLSRVGQLSVGDIVLAKINDKSYVVHRIINIDQARDCIMLMGDGNIVGREQCRLSQVHARVVEINHKGTYINCNTPGQLRRAKLWRSLLPLRRYILGVWRRTPFWPGA